MLKNRQAFSLTELVITLVIVAILAIVAIPIYRGYVKKGIATEGKSLLGEVNAAQQIYYARHGKYFAGSAGQQFSGSLGVNSSRNKYFTSYDIQTSADGQSFTAYTNSAEGHTMNLSGSATQTTASEVNDVSNYAD